jgi:mono/diheme cytochrome c family protein
VIRRACALALAALVCASARGEERAAELVARFQCARCHEGTGAPPPPREQACVGCHRRVLDGSMQGRPESLARWRRDLVSLNQAPSLASRRLKREWLRRFLVEPSDVRPALRATMPRLALTAAQADALAAVFAADEQTPAPPPWPAPPPSRADASAGRALFVASRCATCHVFTGAGVAGPELARPATDAIALAPDLARTRERMTAPAVERLLLDGSGVDARFMPRFPLAPADARALAEFIMTTPLVEPKDARHEPPRLPLLRRRVGWDEVYARVFHVCRHCHAEPELAFGDGGPGNTGGFGFAGRGVDLSSATAASRGELDEHGRRTSLFAPLADGTPRLIALLLARRAEEAGRPVPGLRGMPLALPSLDPEELQLVESWVAQGRPR